MTRGLEEVSAFAGEILTKINTDKNRAKECWKSLPVQVLLAGLKDERREVDEAIADYLHGDADLAAVVSELADEAAYLMMIFDRLRG